MWVGRCGQLLVVQAPAKVNLFLEVLARRADGFHEIETLMAAVSIYDTLYFKSESGGRLRFTCRWSSGLQARQLATQATHQGSMLGDLPSGTGNMVVQALERFRERAGVEFGASIDLVKRIPSAAGLGGASSDVAAVLTAANDAWQLGWSRSRLSRFSAELGSDIPFFFGTGSAVCRGRGERIEVLGRFPAMHVVVARPPAALSTADVYRQCSPAKTPVSLKPLLEAAAAGQLARLARMMVNRLQPIAERLSPWLGRIRMQFQQLDFLGHQMSGSGSSYFGICRHARDARRAASILRSRGVGEVYCATTVAHLAPREANQS